MNVYLIDLNESDFDLNEVVSKECGFSEDEVEEMPTCDAIAMLSDEKFIEYSTHVMSIKEFTDCFNIGGAPSQDNSYIRFI